MAKKDFRRLLFDRGLTILRLARESEVSRETIYQYLKQSADAAPRGASGPKGAVATESGPERPRFSVLPMG